MANQNEHTKYYNSRGEEVPSTTTVIKLYNKNLDNWANYMGLKGFKLKDFLEQKANLGTYIHSVCEKFFSKELEADVHPDTNYVSVHDYQIILYRLKALKEYMYNMGYEPYHTELKMEGETYGGTMDLLFYNKEEDKYILIDLKTAKGTYNTMYMQLMAYRNLFYEKTGILIHKVGIFLIMREPTDPEFCKLYDGFDIAMIRYGEIFKQLLNIYYILTDSERKKLLC